MQNMHNLYFKGLQSFGKTARQLMIQRREGTGHLLWLYGTEDPSGFGHTHTYTYTHTHTHTTAKDCLLFEAVFKMHKVLFV